jgi:DegV family protein with EDD domain
VGDFLAVYEPLVANGDDIVSIHLSGGISGTVRAAEQARDVLIERGMAPERMVVIDSLTGCAGHGFMSVAATNAIAGGADLAGAVAAARAMRENLKIIVMVDTLEYLRRGGRIGAAQAWIGATLKVKPILTIEGEMQPVERVRTASRAFERLVAHLEQRREDGCDGFAIQHVQALPEAERLAERGRAIYGRDPELISEIGPVIGTHTGPGILGVTGLRTDLLGPF